jgi:hypothetical protein
VDAITAPFFKTDFQEPPLRVIIALVDLAGPGIDYQVIFPRRLGPRLLYPGLSVFLQLCEARP